MPAACSYDPCYHQSWESFSPSRDGADAGLHRALQSAYGKGVLVGNLNTRALDEMSDAAAHGVFTFAMTTKSVSGTSTEPSREQLQDAEFALLDGEGAVRAIVADLPDPPVGTSYGVSVVRTRGDDVERPGGSNAPDEVYDVAVWRALPWVAGVLAVVYAGFAAQHAIVLDGTARTVMVPTAAGTGLALASLWLLLRWRRLDQSLAHPLTALVVALVVGNSVAHLVAAAEPRQTTNVILAVIGAGAGLLSLRWFVATLYLTWSAWAVGAALVGRAPQWGHYATALVAATVLSVVINQVVRRAVRDLAAARAQAESSAVRDHLTGLANRRGLAMVGGQIVELARRQGDAVHCIFIDIDNLTAVNDGLGHAAGDEVLVAVADAIRSVTRSTDVVARWGGDEFCLVGPGPGMAPLELERRVRETVSLHPPVPEATWPARVSAGGAMLAPWDSGSLDTLLGKADQEMRLRRSLRREGSSPSPRPASAE